MRILPTPLKSLRKKTLPVIAALLLYVLPNIVQDVHRLFGHSHISYSKQLTLVTSIHSSVENCLVCHFEFYTADETPATVRTVILATCNTFLSADVNHQFSSKVFDYSQLRAPPVS